MNRILKYRKEIVVLVFITIFSCVSLLFTLDSICFGDDLSFHLNRLVGVANAIRDGQIIPRIYPDVNYGYGYGSPLFYCDLFIYPFAILYLLGIDLINTYRIMIIFYSFLTCLNALVFSRNVFKKFSTSVNFTCFFVLSNYRLYDVYNRAAVGEFIAISFIPLALYSMYKILVKKEDSYVMLALSYSCLVLSHLITAVLMSIIYLVFFIISLIKNDDRKRILFTSIKGAGLGVLLCAWFIFPMLEQVYSQEFYFMTSSGVFESYPRLEKIGEIVNPINGINKFDILLFLLSFTYLFNKRKSIDVTILFVISMFLFMVMTGIIPFFSQISFIQFMFRLNIILYPFVVIIVSYVFDTQDNLFYKYIYCAIVAFMIINLFNRNNILSDEKMINKNNVREFISYDLEHAYYNRAELAGAEYLPVCNNIDYSDSDQLIVLESDEWSFVEQFADFNKLYTHIDFNYSGDATFASLPLTYYKGYACFCDAEEINCINDELYKKVGLSLSKGKHHYSIYYAGTKVQRTSLIISFLAVVFILFRYVYCIAIKKKRDLV